jgi:hypothetical protein
MKMIDMFSLEWLRREVTSHRELMRKCVRRGDGVGAAFQLGQVSVYEDLLEVLEKKAALVD